MKKLSKIAALVGSILLATMYFGTASAEANPFAKADQVQTVAGDGKDAKCGEGKCGGDKKKKGEGKCGEGKCGGDKAKKKGEGKCGEGKCGGDKKKKKGKEKCGEGKCGDKKKKKGEGKCGEGKCGGK
ncbi:hypothetical protein [Aliikangiella coralliicola]|uniref:Low-complexity protein n=1 Tax=Aliikangiella coralliicola TaxID=2592383 RepID=A0A545U0A6_9GAMM|nr:hypothetical protein [Aliikangiella coralliicola]TQV82896.1 hypothetical protein FLL46_24305 [Aliikangiella coralliicola]